MPRGKPCCLRHGMAWQSNVHAADKGQCTMQVVFLPLPELHSPTSWPMTPPPALPLATQGLPGIILQAKRLARTCNCAHALAHSQHRHRVHFCHAGLPEQSARARWHAGQADGPHDAVGGVAGRAEVEGCTQREGTATGKTSFPIWGAAGMGRLHTTRQGLEGNIPKGSAGTGTGTGTSTGACAGMQAAC